MKAQISLISLLLLFILSLIHIDEQAPKVEQENPSLKTIMRLIMTDMDLINEGIYTQDFLLIQEGSAAINAHPPLSDKTRALIKRTLKENMPAFAQYDKIVHDHADSLNVAASNKDMKKVLEQYHIIESGCVACHASFRDPIRDAIAKDQ